MGGPGNRSISVRLNGRDLEYIGFLAKELSKGKTKDVTLSDVVRELIRRDRAAAMGGEYTVPMTNEEREILKRVLSRI